MVNTMANLSQQKLELTWFGKGIEIKVEPRILIEDTEKSNCVNDPNTENMLIHGDNLLALKALESKYAGKVKCVYIEITLQEMIPSLLVLLKRTL